jgi:hypothetical protein
VGEGEDRVGDPRHRGDDHDEGRLALVPDNLERVANRGGVGQRGAAELMHFGCTALAWWHERESSVESLESRAQRLYP